MRSQKFYDLYHSRMKIQWDVIRMDDFTYGNILKCVASFIPNNSNVLDIGSGSGTLSFYFASNRNRVLGIDISKRAILFARENAESLNLNKSDIAFVCGDIMKLKIKQKFDLIACFEVMEHLVEDSAFLKRILGFMRLSSVLLLSVPSIKAPLYRLGVLNRFDQEVGHLRRYSEIQLKHLFETCGFKILKICKCEGILRNLLFTNRYFGNFIRFVRLPYVKTIFGWVDNIFIQLLGESQIIVVAVKK